MGARHRRRRARRDRRHLARQRLLDQLRGDQAHLDRRQGRRPVDGLRQRHARTGAEGRTQLRASGEVTKIEVKAGRKGDQGRGARGSRLELRPRLARLRRGGAAGSRRSGRNGGRSRRRRNRRNCLRGRRASTEFVDLVEGTTGATGEGEVAPTEGEVPPTEGEATEATPAQEKAEREAEKAKKEAEARRKPPESAERSGSGEKVDDRRLEQSRSARPRKEAATAANGSGAAVDLRWRRSQPPPAAAKQRRGDGRRVGQPADRGSEPARGRTHGQERPPGSPRNDLARADLRHDRLRLGVGRRNRLRRPQRRRHLRSRRRAGPPGANPRAAKARDRPSWCWPSCTG